MASRMLLCLDPEELPLPVDWSPSVSHGAGAGLRRGLWTEHENLRYHWFLELHHGHFMNRHLRKIDKIFSLMESFVGSRLAEQCRSHHQKMERKHKTFVNILAAFRMQHYQTLHPGPVEQAFEEGGIELVDPLVTAEELKLQCSEEKPLPRLRRAAGRLRKFQELGQKEEQGRGEPSAEVVKAVELVVVGERCEVKAEEGLDMQLSADHGCQLFNSMFK